MSTYTLKLQGDTPEDLVAMARAYVASHVGASEPSHAPVDDPADVTVTNDDYRRAIGCIPPGRVASYSVVSVVVRGDAEGRQKVAGIAANDTTAANAYRVVRSNGAIAAGFRWADGRMGGREEAHGILEQEGVRFDGFGRVAPESMLSADELSALYRGD